MEENLNYQDIINTFIEEMKNVGLELNKDEIHYRGFCSQGDGASFDFKLLNLDETVKFLNAIGFVPPGDGNLEYILNTSFEAFDIYTSKNSFATNYCHEKTRNVNINWQCKEEYNWDFLIKEVKHYVIDWYCGECIKLYKLLEERYYVILDHENESEILDQEMTISDRIDSMIDPEMNIYKVIEMIRDAKTVSFTKEGEAELIDKFAENFNNEYLIIKKSY